MKHLLRITTLGFRTCLTLFLLCCCIGVSSAQQNDLFIDMSPIDGIELTPQNIFNYRIDNNSGHSQSVEVNGRVYYRRSAMYFTYSYRITLLPGSNMISANTVPSPSWNFSETGLRELFQNYGKLPQGTYEYCVNLKPQVPGSEQDPSNDPSSCIYQTVDDLFLINLVTPENDAKIYEFNPMLAWVVNYPFAAELTYKLRVAELKEGQNPQNAITRNNPMYKDDHVMTTGTVYPVYAKPLQKWQPYVWTVDAYYKGILLGGAEVWKFTIIDDSELVAVPRESFYVDIRKEQNTSVYYAVGEIKLKYILDEKNEEILSVTLRDHKGKSVSIPFKELKVVLGDNRLDIDLKEKVHLKHMGKYTLEVKNTKGNIYLLPLKYVNPELLN